MLADKTVDLVIVNTPSYTHYEYAKQALQAGKHVIVEKPFTATSPQAEELQALAKKQNKLLSVFQNRRHDSDFKTVQKVIKDDLLGEITEVEIHYDRFNPVLSPKAHKETPGPAVGVVYDLGSHLIDQALHLFGMPTAVWADVFSMRPNSKVDDYLEIVLFYPTKRVRLKSTYYAREPLGYIVHGKKGSFVKSRADVQEPALQASQSPVSGNWGIEPETERGLLHTERDGIVIKEHIPTLQGNYGEYYDGVYKALTTSSEPPVSSQDGINTIRIIEASYLSSKERKLIEL
jgi:predicted dehydrogenase